MFTKIKFYFLLAAIHIHRSMENTDDCEGSENEEHNLGREHLLGVPAEQEHEDTENALSPHTSMTISNDVETLPVRIIDISCPGNSSKFPSKPDQDHKKILHLRHERNLHQQQRQIRQHAYREEHCEQITHKIGPHQEDFFQNKLQLLSQTSLILSSKYNAHSPEFTIPRRRNGEDVVNKSSDYSHQVSYDQSKTYNQENCDKLKNVSKVSGRAKKKSWYSVFYPSYKSRSEDFKKLFKDVPDDERLVVDYSCALQRDILIHGRLYVSQNYICFYANIFRWETSLSIKWKDVTSITKEKTARVIPNAISVCTDNDRHFFTSLTTRDKSFLMLFRVWQNALMDKPMQPQEMWQWVHNCYGDELGLTSDDEDYIDPYSGKEDDQHANQLSYVIAENKTIETFCEDPESQSDTVDVTNNVDDNSAFIFQREMRSKIIPIEAKRKMQKNSRQREVIVHDAEHFPTDISDSSDSDQNQNIPFVSTAECNSTHEGRQLVHTILPINIDMLFALLFSKSKFLTEFHAARKSTDMVHRDWIINEQGLKQRTVNVTVALSQTVGPKSSQVTEVQVMRDCSRPGELYSIDVDSNNAGIPYAESFCVLMHYCLVKTVDDHTMLSVHAQINYKKSIWAPVRGFIEKNTWNGLEDFYTAMLRALQNDYCIPSTIRKTRRPRRGICNTIKLQEDIPLLPINDTSTQVLINPQQTLAKPSRSLTFISWVFIALIIVLITLNMMLLVKLRTFDSNSADTQSPIGYHLWKGYPKNQNDWIRLVMRLESSHENEAQKWQIVLQVTIDVLRKVSVICEKNY